MLKTVEDVPIALALSPTGHVYVDNGAHIQEVLPIATAEKIKIIFAHENAYGLLHLGIRSFEGNLSPSFSFWQSLAHSFVTEVCKQYGSLGKNGDITIDVVPSQQECMDFVDQAPFFKGAEYISAAMCKQVWRHLSVCLTTEVMQSGKSLENYLCAYNPSWSQVGRICFHLAENKDTQTDPFAFLITYTSRLSRASSVQHLPLKRALQECTDEKNNSALLNLLLPIQKAATHSKLIKELVDSGSIFQPLFWTAQQAHQFLQDIPLFESSGIMVRIPNWWNPKKPTRPHVSVTIGNVQCSKLGFDSLMDFDLHVVLDENTRLTEDELQAIFSSTDTFIKIKGQWLEVDRDKLRDVLSYWKKIQREVKNKGLSFREGVRLYAGIQSTNQDMIQDETAINGWSHVTAGDWLKKTLHALHNPEELDTKKNMLMLSEHLHATLRPYQVTGVGWLWLLYRLKLGGCLADDMGLGKTIQVISLMLLIKFTEPKKKIHLLVVPASLLGNWKKELTQFAPELAFFIAHNSVNNLDQVSIEQLNSFDVVITTYAALLRIPWITLVQWDLLVIDEAQMIKNPSAKQTRTVKTLNSNVRLSLTGTPIENRLADLWSLFDFTLPGLLGLSKSFDDHRKKYLQKDDPSSKAVFYSALRTLISPYILRRLKSDKRIIQDLPDKTEIQAYCMLSKQQAFLYQQAVRDLKHALEFSPIGIERRGLVLSYILRFKQICNHPDQWLGYGGYASEDSGKFLRLQEICEEIAAKQEKVLVFTQFREMIEPLARFLTGIFGREGLVLHGETAIQKRPQLVESFQQEQGPPFFVLSLKAGGTGLNLTNASHVIHFDRWWNPAVENQATDRAYRIGQKKNVLVHAFICRGTIEEKINDLLVSKKTLSHELLSDNGDVMLTELSNDELIKIVSLDLDQVLVE